MKTRLGFVSNSSSSSYTCQICHRTESGMDLGYYDAGMWQCKLGHTFCAEHAVGEVDDDEDPGYVPESCCPICTFQDIPDGDLAAYFLKTFRLKREAVVAVVKRTHGDYKSFRAWLKDEPQKEAEDVWPASDTESLSEVIEWK
jgi:hypothetical protein